MDSKGFPELRFEGVSRMGTPQNSLQVLRDVRCVLHKGPVSDGNNSVSVKSSLFLYVLLRYLVELDWNTITTSIPDFTFYLVFHSHYVV